MSLLSLLYVLMFSAYLLLLVATRDKITDGPRRVRRLSHVCAYVAGTVFLAQYVLCVEATAGGRMLGWGFSLGVVG